MRSACIHMDNNFIIRFYCLLVCGYSSCFKLLFHSFNSNNSLKSAKNHPYAIDDELFHAFFQMIALRKYFIYDDDDDDDEDEV